MNNSGSASTSVPTTSLPAGPVADTSVPADAERPCGADKSYDRVARLAAVVLSTPRAFVAIAGERSSLGRDRVGARDMAAPEWQVEQSWCQYVIESGNKLIINDARLDPREPLRGERLVSNPTLKHSVQDHHPEGMDEVRDIFIALGK